ERPTPETILRGSGGVVLGGRDLRPRACGLGKAVADFVPGDLGVGVRVRGTPPRGILGHRPILRMIERSDLNPDVRIPLVEEGHRRTAMGAEPPLGEAAGAIVAKLALREPERRSWNAHRRVEEAAAALLALLRHGELLTRRLLSTRKPTPEPAERPRRDQNRGPHGLPLPPGNPLPVAPRSSVIGTT